MTIQGAISELQNLLGADDIPLYYKTAIEKVIETIMDALEREPQDEFDGMIFSTDKYMAFIDKKEIHIMRKSACKVTMERMFNTEEDEYKPMPKHGQSADRPRPIDPTITVDLESGVVPISACEPKAPKTIVYADRVYAERPRGRWHYSDGKPATIGQSFGVICDQCGTESEYCTNFCGECGADMRGEDE